VPALDDGSGARASMLDGRAAAWDDRAVRARYPLTELATLRGTRARATALELAEAITAEAKALAARDAAAERVAAWVRAARAVTLVDDQPLRAAEVVQRAAYAQRLRRDAGRARELLAAREDELALAQAAVAQARGEATQARGEREVVDRHRERWTDERRKARERLDET
jgi:hypothetical protein